MPNVLISFPEALLAAVDARLAAEKSKIQSALTSAQLAKAVDIIRQRGQAAGDEYQYSILRPAPQSRTKLIISLVEFALKNKVVEPILLKPVTRPKFPSTEPPPLVPTGLSGKLRPKLKRYVKAP